MRYGPRWPWWLALAALGACGRPAFPCQRNAQCDAHDSGFCEPAQSLCAYADPSCESGGRYGSVAGASSKACVEAMPQFTATAWRLETPPTIDGDISDLALGLGSRASSEFGVRGTVWFRWDDAGLYVAAEISDPNLESETHPGVSMFARDGLELLFDTNADRAEGRIPLPDDFKLVITAAGEVGWSWGGIEPTEVWDTPTASFVRADGTLNQAADADVGYTLEAHVPWSDDLRAPESGASWGFNFKVNDADVARARSAQWMNNPRFNFPSQAGTLRFAVPGEVPAAEPAPRSPAQAPPRFEKIGDLGELVTESPTTFRPEQPMKALFDGCISRLDDCRTAAPAVVQMELTFDLGAPRELGFARLFGDQSGTQISRSWQLEVKSGDRFDRIAGTGLDREVWSLLDLRGTTAQVIRLRVEGVEGQGTEAAEFELYARP